MALPVGTLVHFIASPESIVDHELHGTTWKVKSLHRLGLALAFELLERFDIYRDGPVHRRFSSSDFTENRDYAIIVKPKRNKNLGDI